MKLPDELIPGRAVLLDRNLIRRVYAERAAHGNDPRDEMWDGVLVLLPLVDNDHQRIAWQFCMAFHSLGDEYAVRPGGNVSDRVDGWMTNFRRPDVLVFTPDTAARCCDTHWLGGPDFTVEVASPGEDPREKLGFYARVGAREVLVVDRDPWAVELFRSRDGRSEPVGVSDAIGGVELTSEVLPFAFRLEPGVQRPVIHIRHTGTGQSWTA